ncbi:MAG: T9SS type A sorting domain-containing protein [Ichthyobacteriaceae bacterium]|nr:T9SS type A sorting domain-containing protein [Ichthyobacteriaceae bacterium]
MKRLLLTLLLSTIYLNSYSQQKEELQMLVASDKDIGDWFGMAVSIDGNNAVVSAPGDGSYYDYGAVYVYTYKEGTGWTEKQKLSHDDSTHRFGSSVCIKGENIIIGAYKSHSAYIYSLDENDHTWKQKAELYPLVGEWYIWGSFFGSSVAIEDNKAFVGATSLNDTGAVFCYIFDEENSSWNFKQLLEPKNGDKSDIFGFSISISNNNLIIGAPKDDDNGTDSGSVYFYSFDENKNIWKENSKITPDDIVGNDFFGWDVSISQNFAIAGAYRANNYTGSAYIMEQNESTKTWNLTNKLTSLDGTYRDFFGCSVDIDVGVAIVGAYGVNDEEGSAYIYTYNKDEKNWRETNTLVASQVSLSRYYDYFGYSVSISGTNSIAGSYYNSNMGSAYIFNNISNPNYLTNVNIESDDCIFYPNPVKNKLTVKTKTSGITTIKILNSIGEVILSKTSTSNSFSIDFQNYSSGIYILNVKTKNGNSIKKIVKK